MFLEDDKMSIHTCQMSVKVSCEHSMVAWLVGVFFLFFSSVG